MGRNCHWNSEEHHYGDIIPYVPGGLHKDKFNEGQEGTARYAGLVLTPAEVFGQGQGFCYPLGKKRVFMMFFDHFWPFQY